MRILNASPSGRQLDAGLLVIRAMVGLAFIAHGLQKLFSFGVGSFAGVLGELGVPAAGLAAGLVVLVEVGGGAALVLGLLTRVVCAGMVATMAGAIVLVHLPHGFFGPEGYAYPLTLLVVASGLMVVGAGGWSLDARLSRASGGDEPGGVKAVPTI